MKELDILFGERCVYKDLASFLDWTFTADLIWVAHDTVIGVVCDFERVV